IWNRKGGTHGIGGLELISSYAKLVDMLAQMPCLDGANNYPEVQDNVDVQDKDEAEVVDNEEDEGEFVDSDYDEGDRDDMEGDNEGTSQVRRKKKNCLSLSNIGGRWT
ncbi:unnamed protein product, partial [Prunus brigantina]